MADQSQRVNTRVLVNAVSAKSGGAATILRSFCEYASNETTIQFYVFAGIHPEAHLPENIEWVILPKSGMSAWIFNLLSSSVLFWKHKCDILLSFNNVNCPFIKKNKRVTYFHQMLALGNDSKKSIKYRLIHLYHRMFSDQIVVQTETVKNAYLREFPLRNVITCWPGTAFSVDTDCTASQPKIDKTILVPISDISAPHKNFDFVIDLAENLPVEWRILVTTDRVPNSKNIFAAGVLDHEGMRQAMKSADFVLFTSKVETVGLPIFEAISLGTPVIAFDAPYVQELKSHFSIDESLKIVKSPDCALDVLENGGVDPSLKIRIDVSNPEWSKLKPFFTANSKDRRDQSQ